MKNLLIVKLRCPSVYITHRFISVTTGYLIFVILSNVIIKVVDIKILTELKKFVRIITEKKNIFIIHISLDGVQI